MEFGPVSGGGGVSDETGSSDAYPLSIGILQKRRALDRIVLWLERAK